MRVLPLLGKPKLSTLRALGLSGDHNRGAAIYITAPPEFTLRSYESYVGLRLHVHNN